MALRKKKDGKAYDMNIIKRYEATVKKDHGAFKKGDEIVVTMPLAIKFAKLGVISITDQMKVDAKELGCGHLFGLKDDAETGDVK